jgi:hypothetical protein
MGYGSWNGRDVLEFGRIGEMIEPQRRRSAGMKRRIAIWASVGFLVACCWVLYTFATPPEQLMMILREPVVEILLFITCPLVFAGRSFALPFWCVPLINAASYAVIGLTVEALRRKLHPSVAT